MSSSACSACQSAGERAFARRPLALLARLGRGCGRGALRARLPVILLAALSIGLTIIILDEVACSARKQCQCVQPRNTPDALTFTAQQT